MRKVDVLGKSQAEVDRLTKNLRRADLLALLAKAVALDVHFTSGEIAKARKMPKRVVIQKMRSGEIRAHKPRPNQWNASLQDIRDWDEQTALSLVGP